MVSPQEGHTRVGVLSGTSGGLIWDNYEVQF